MQKQVRVVLDSGAWWLGKPTEMTDEEQTKLQNGIAELVDSGTRDGTGYFALETNDFNWWCFPLSRVQAVGVVTPLSLNGAEDL